MNAGHEVWGTSRDPERLSQLPRLHPIVLDLSNTQSINMAFTQALSEAGNFDVVINNAGDLNYFGPRNLFRRRLYLRNFKHSSSHTWSFAALLWLPCAHTAADASSMSPRWRRGYPFRFKGPTMPRKLPWLPSRCRCKWSSKDQTFASLMCNPATFTTPSCMTSSQIFPKRMVLTPLEWRTSGAWPIETSKLRQVPKWLRAASRS